MFLEHLKVNNFRQLKNVEVCFNQDLTFIAGGNNSGKTSLINIMEFAFNDNKVISYEDMTLSVFKSMLKIIEKEVNEISTIKNIEEEFNAFQAFLLELSDDTYSNIQLYYTLNIEDTDDLRNIGNFIIAIEEDLKLHFLIQYGLSKEKLSKMDDVVERLYNHIKLLCEKEIKTKTLSDYAHIMSLLKQISSKKISYCSCIIQDEKYYYGTDKEKQHEVSKKDYYKFIQTQLIPAHKNLGEYTDSEKGLNRLMIENVRSNLDGWDQKLMKITEDFRLSIDKVIKPEALNEQISYLNEQMTKYQKLNGNQNEVLELVFMHTYQTAEKYLEAVWNIHSRTSENYDSYTLPNSKQGLGFNHLLYIYFYIEMMKIQSHNDNASFNFLIIEEPENHMHPHMQQMLVRYLYEEKDNLNFQIIITTHSSDIAKNLEIEDIRVLRKQNYETHAFDLSVFMKNLENDHRKFYEKFFSVTIYPIIFSDKAIFYEGDTERLFFETLLSHSQLLKEIFKEKTITEASIVNQLRSSYISLIQVSGDYAHRYFHLVDYLEIKTVVFTDIDYDKKIDSLSQINVKDTINGESIKISSNSVLSSVIELNEVYNVNELFEFMSNGVYVTKSTNGYTKTTNETIIKVFTQTEKDGFARTLEDAMLFNYLKNQEVFNKSFAKGVFVQLTKDEWTELSNNHKIKIPNIGDKDVKEQSIRTRVQKGLTSSSNKTDFMYSFLMQEAEALASAVPTYIRKGLGWLVSEE